MDDFVMGKKNTCKPLHRGEIEDETNERFFVNKADSDSDGMDETISRAPKYVEFNLKPKQNGSHTRTTVNTAKT